MKQSWDTLTETQRLYFIAFYANGYGTRFTGMILRKIGLEELIGVKAYRYHDWAFFRGGNINDFIRANIYFKNYATIDLLESEHKWYWTLFGHLIINIFTFTVYTVGVFFFQWGDYKSLPSDEDISEIIKL